jgi:predicted phosphodiesterase
VGRVSIDGRQIVSGAVVVALALLLTAVLLPLARTQGDVGPGTVSVGLALVSDGDTVLDVPPLGRVRVNSHRSPLELQARVEAIDIPAATALAQSGVATLEEEHRDELADLVMWLVLRVVAVAAAAGVVAGLIVRDRGWRHLALGVGSSLTAVGILFGLTWSSYSVESFRSPQFEGTLSRAPEALDALEREYDSLAGLRDRMNVLAAQITTLSAQAADPGSVAVSGDDVRILHISDVHLNPLGLEFASSLAERFDVDAILDTGDLTSFGLPYEAEIGRWIAQMPVPYYFVPGNHDSPSNRARLALVPNLTVLDRSSVSIRGVEVLGIPDPATSVAPDEDGVSGEEARAARLDVADAVAALTAEQTPDVLAVAGLDLAAGAVGAVPLVVSGDVHERTSEVRDGTLLLTVGTTGAGGLGRFTQDTGRPYAAQVLRFVDGRLVALDYVTVNGLDGGFSVDRVVYTQ